MTTGIGSFRVKADPAEVAAFRKATGLGDAGATLPLTFPMRWMVRQEVRAAILAMVVEPDIVLVHESQSFDYERPLVCGEDYVLALSARRESAPDRLFVDGTISGGQGTLCKIETILRLFSTEAAAT